MEEPRQRVSIRMTSEQDAQDELHVKREGSLLPPNTPKSSFVVLSRKSIPLEVEGSSSWVTGKALMTHGSCSSAAPMQT